MKIKNSIRRKVLTSLLIGATLGTTITGFGVSKSFANSNLSDLKPVSKEVSDNIINEMAKARSSSIYSYVYPEPICKSLVKANGSLYLVDNHNRRIYSGIFVDPNGHMLYFNSNGKAVQDDWMNINQSGYNGRYYFGPQYKAHKNTVTNVRGKDYFFDNNGHMKTGFQKWNGETYYFDSSSGIKHLGGWLNQNGNRYRFNSERGGAMVKGWDYDRGGAMYFHDSGVMTPSGATYVNRTDQYHPKTGYYLFTNSGGGYTYQNYGWWSEGGKRYYFDPYDNGRAVQNGWIQTTGRGSNITGRVYFGSDGTMAKGVTQINGETHVFIQTNSKDQNHYEGLGWYTDKSTGKRYFFNDGVNARSATEFRNTTPKGAAVKGKQIINGQTYEFDNNGVLKK